MVYSFVAFAQKQLDIFLSPIYEKLNYSQQAEDPIFFTVSTRRLQKRRRRPGQNNKDGCRGADAEVDFSRKKGNL